MNVNDKMRELAQYTRMQEELNSLIEALKDELKAYMTAQGIEDLQGDEHRATWRIVPNSRIDAKTLKKELPEIAEKYTIHMNNRRFVFK